MNRKCSNCNKDFEHGISANMIIYCPNCKKNMGSISDYGFGPIVPCDVYLGDKIIASLSSMDEIVSEYFGIRKALCGKYANLEIYHEVEKIIDELLK